MLPATRPDRGDEALRTLLLGDPVHVAPRLLGSYLSTAGTSPVVLRITEVEAYRGADDPASHAYRGRTARNAAMFLQAGSLYVYWHMGVHFCLNVVTWPTGQPGAVLVRAGEVVRGVDVARRRRDRARRLPLAGAQAGGHRLASGPGNVGRCLGANLTWDRTDLLDGSGPLLLSVPTAPDAAAGDAPGALAGCAAHVRTGPRVGVSTAGADPARFGWRFWLDGEPSVSTFRPAVRARSTKQLG